MTTTDTALTAMSEEPQEHQTAAGTAPNVEDVRRVVVQHFPALWPAVDLGLATCVTLLLADNANPTAVIYVGGPRLKG